jgi:hypothetical protein
MPMQDRRSTPFALGRPTSKPYHLGIRSGFVDEDQSIGIKLGLTVEPVLAASLDVRAHLLGRVLRLQVLGYLM